MIEFEPDFQTRPLAEQCLSLRHQLVAFIEELLLEMLGELQDDTSLISSGLCDSLALVHLAEWIQRATGSPVDFTAFDLAQEWDTIPDILNFIAKHRRDTVA
jgi:aryl carrier-like protein